MIYAPHILPILSYILTQANKDSVKEKVKEKAVEKALDFLKKKIKMCIRDRHGKESLSYLPATVLRPYVLCRQEPSDRPLPTADW